MKNPLKKPLKDPLKESLKDPSKEPLKEPPKTSLLEVTERREKCKDVFALAQKETMGL